jgi:hypothetical protein
MQWWNPLPSVRQLTAFIVKDRSSVATRAIRSLAWIAVAVVAVVLASVSGALVLSYVPTQWQSDVALAGSLLILVLAVVTAIFQRSKREPGFIGATKKVALSLAGGLLLLVGAYALLMVLMFVSLQ